jgi:hypothetical protein
MTNAWMGIPVIGRPARLPGMALCPATGPVALQPEGGSK